MTQRMNVALIGSTGGGTATHGHTDAAAFLKAIHKHLLQYDALLLFSGYVALDQGKGMDAVDLLADQATLYTTFLSESEELFYKLESRGPLNIVNEYIENVVDRDMAEKIENGAVHALICISCNPQLHKRTLRAAAAAEIPVTGSGGTSLSQISALYGVDLVGNAGGSVATTTSSRAMSYSYALAQHWNRTSESGKLNSANSWSIAEFRSVLNASLPAFWTCCLLKYILQCFSTSALLRSREDDIDSIIELLSVYALPIACSVAMASNNVEESRESTQVSALLVAILVCKSSILSGLLSGWIVRRLHQCVMASCIACNVPATMTTLATTGLTTVFVSLAVAPISPMLKTLTETIRAAIALSAEQRPIGGFLWGLFVCYGSKVGWYHSIVLPLILVEMETADASFLGAVDYLALVLVCAGVCAGQLAFDPHHQLCWRGLRTNLMYGDFVEACYPFMDLYPLINVACYLSSGLASAFLVTDGLPKSMAYLPFIGSVLIAGRRHWRTIAAASCLAFFIPFLVAALVFQFHQRISARSKK